MMAKTRNIRFGMNHKVLKQLADELDSPLINDFKGKAPYWAEQRIDSWSEDYFRMLKPFVTQKQWVSNNSIHIFSVVGTDHPDYSGLSWWELLHAGKRMQHNHQWWKRNPVYYQEQKNREPKIYYKSLDGLNWYVDGDGNHRTCIARFDAYINERCVLHSVETVQYKVDFESFRIMEKLNYLIADKKLFARAYVTQTPVKRIDGPGWKNDYFQVCVVYEDMRLRREREVSVEDFEYFYNALKRKRRFFWFGR